MVKDTPTVLGEVDRIILELDQPATPSGKPYTPSQARHPLPVLPIAAPSATPYVPPPPTDEFPAVATPSAPIQLPDQATTVVPEAAECEIFEAPIIVPGMAN